MFWISVVNLVRWVVDYRGVRDVDISWSDFSVDFGWSLAGFVSVSWGRWAFHFGVDSGFWVWGHEYVMPDFCMDSWGFGPLFLLVRLN